MRTYRPISALVILTSLACGLGQKTPEQIYNSMNVGEKVDYDRALNHCKGHVDRVIDECGRHPTATCEEILTTLSDELLQEIGRRPWMTEWQRCLRYHPRLCDPLAYEECFQVLLRDNGV